AVVTGVPVTLVLSLALVGGLGAFLFLPGRRQGLSRWAMGLAGALYIGMPFNYYLLLYTSQPNGRVWTLFTIFAVVVSDAAALLVGSRIGRHPFFASISPRKTVEGAIAGVVGSVLVMLIGVSAVLGINPLHAIAIGLLAGISGQVGDLVESQMKRIAEVLVRGQAGESGFDKDVEAMVTDPRCDLVVVAIPGARALRPTMAALAAKKEIALATKEVLVMAGALVMRAAGERGIRPIDS